MKGIITKTGSVAYLPHTFVQVTHSSLLFTAWGERVELLETKSGAKTRRARVFVKTFDQSRLFSEVMVEVRIPVDLDNKQAVCLASHKAYSKGIGYAWVMWARQRIAQKYKSLDDSEHFQLVLKNLSAEWMPRDSAEGRAHIESVLKLGSFSATAFSGLEK
jgi:hypothetical protein